MTALHIQSDVAQALTDGRPLVALETAVVTHGLDRPKNLEVARLMHVAVRAAGAIPAMIGVIDGTLTLGLTDDQIASLAADDSAMKVSTRDLAWARLKRVNAGTTVAATLHACARAKPGAIRCFATGGIGGVHRGWTTLPDVSADLETLARTPVCVVCAGAKSILDLRATLERLETLGVPVIGYQTDWFPQFVCASDSSLPVPYRLDSAAEIAQFCHTHWCQLHQETAVVVAAAVDQQFALAQCEFEAASQIAERGADERHIRGPARTPFLLRSIAQQTDGRSVRANESLLRRNASLAAEIAVAMTDRENLS